MRVDSARLLEGLIMCFETGTCLDGKASAFPGQRMGK